MQTELLRHILRGRSSPPQGTPPPPRPYPVSFPLVLCLQVYRKFAEERESEGHYEGSIEYWAKSLEAARSAGDQAALGQACYRLGKAYTELEDPTRYAMTVKLNPPPPPHGSKRPRLTRMLRGSNDLVLPACTSQNGCCISAPAAHYI